jgi:C4-dicarboxylate-specific signal transduction histidine kinase
MEYRLRRRDGEYRNLLDCGVPRFGPEGEFLGYIGSCVDITERNRAELEAQQQRNELAHLSRVSMLAELSGSLAHELNQPLTAILCNSQAAQRILRQDKFDIQEVRAILKDIADDDERAGEVIRRLRLLLKKGVVHQQPLDVNGIVHDVLQIVRNDLMNRGVGIRAELVPELPAIHADRVQLQQVLLNLIMNGCDAMANIVAADRKLSVRTEQTDDSVRIIVTDNGCGIPAGQMEQVFEPFFTTKEQGLGLGLTVCRSIVAAHNGRLWATNDATGGARFYVQIPAFRTGEAASC